VADLDRAEIIGDAPPDAGAGIVVHWEERSRRLVDRVRPPRSPAPPGSGGTARRTRWLITALVAALVVIVVLAGSLYADRYQSARQREAVALARSWVRAIDGHDLDGVRRSTVPGATAVVVGPSGVLDRPFRGRVFLLGGQLSFRDEVGLRITGEPGPVQELQVTLPTVLTCEGKDHPQLTVLTLQRVGGQLKVASAVMTSTPPASPSASSPSASPTGSPAGTVPSA
jgi:hypothetical protein